MITLSKSGNTVTFTFDENSGYLQNGTIDVPVNSLSLILDESDMATFRKSASNDIFVSALVGDFGMSKTELEAWYKENMVGSTGGGGGDITSGEVQTMIDESISGKADTSAVTQSINAAVSGKIDSESAVTNVKVLTVSQQNEVQIAQSKGDSTASTFVGTVYRVGSGLTWNYQTKEFAVDSSTVALKSDIPSTSGYADSVAYDSNTKYMKFYNGGTGGTMVYQFDASPFLIDGMIDDVRIETISGVSYLVIDFNTASGKEDIQIPLTDIFDPSNYYTKQEVDASLSGKQDTLSAGTNITISGNVISAEGGKAIEAGRGIAITTGETADTVSFDLPISAGTNNSLVFIDTTSSSNGNGCVSIGRYCQASGNNSFAQGFKTKASSYYSHSEGEETTASGHNSHSEGAYVYATNPCEHSQGKYNVSNKTNTTWGDSGNTLFSVGNGTANNARHNAFEIRQNGDIYLSLNGQDVKLQDQLGGGGTVDQTIISGSTNAVAGGAVYDKFDEVEQVTAAGLNAVNDKFDGLKLKKLTQAEYNALATKDASTLYIIVN